MDRKWSQLSSALNYCHRCLKSRELPLWMWLVHGQCNWDPGLVLSVSRTRYGTTLVAVHRTGLESWLLCIGLAWEGPACSLHSRESRNHDALCYGAVARSSIVSWIKDRSKLMVFHKEVSGLSEWQWIWWLLHNDHEWLALGWGGVQNYWCARENQFYALKTC